MRIDLPKQWPHLVKEALIQIMSMTHYSMVYCHGWCANSRIERVRLRSKLEQLRQEYGALQEILNIVSERLARIPSRTRPRYSPQERLRILEVISAQGWSYARAARVFHVDEETLKEWRRRLNDEGSSALVQLPAPVNKFPEFVGMLIRRLKVLCPAMSIRKIAEFLARAGLHLGATTVWRMLRHRKLSSSGPTGKRKGATPIGPESPREIRAERPNHIWIIDLTIVPTFGGLKSLWFPFSYAQFWPFCWWVAVLQDVFSRRVIGFALFPAQPSTTDIRNLMRRAIRKVGEKPGHLISDKGGQFWCPEFKKWAERMKIDNRFGAAGKYGSIAIIERFIRTMKQEGTRKIRIPFLLPEFRFELGAIMTWYNEERPHATLKGRTPSETYCRTKPRNRWPRFEPRSRWPRSAPCAAPAAPMRHDPGVEFDLKLSFMAGRKHLPVVRLRKRMSKPEQARIA